MNLDSEPKYKVSNTPSGINAHHEQHLNEQRRQTGLHDLEPNKQAHGCSAFIHWHTHGVFMIVATRGLHTQNTHKPKYIISVLKRTCFETDTDNFSTSFSRLLQYTQIKHTWMTHTLKNKCVSCALCVCSCNWYIPKSVFY